MGSSAVLVMAYGTPASPDEIEPYYTHIRGGRPPSPEALAELKERYQAIGGRSPLTEITERQADALARRLSERLGEDVRPYVGMKHAPPFIAEAVAAMARDGVSRALAIVMTPQFSSMSVGGYQRAVADALQQSGSTLDVRYVDFWHTHPGFCEAVARRLRAALATLPEAVRAEAAVIFTAHSLPERIVALGDPYPRHLEESAEAVARRAGLQRWEVAYQSAGRTADPWLGPDVSAVIPALPARGFRAVVVCPVGFVADHLEVLYDLDIEARNAALAAGLAFARTASLNDAPDFIDALASIALPHLAAGERGHAR